MLVRAVGIKPTLLSEQDFEPRRYLVNQLVSRDILSHICACVLIPVLIPVLIGTATFSITRDCFGAEFRFLTMETEIATF